DPLGLADGFEVLFLSSERARAQSGDQPHRRTCWNGKGPSQAFLQFVVGVLDKTLHPRSRDGKHPRVVPMVDAPCMKRLRPDIARKFFGITIDHTDVRVNNLAL